MMRNQAAQQTLRVVLTGRGFSTSELSDSGRCRLGFLAVCIPTVGCFLQFLHEPSKAVKT